MSTKIPCGGFYVGDGLNVDENGVLSVVNGKVIMYTDTSDGIKATPEEIIEHYKNGNLVVIKSQAVKAYAYTFMPLISLSNIGAPSGTPCLICKGESTTYTYYYDEETGYFQRRD